MDLALPIVGPIVNGVWLIADRHSPIFSISYPLAVADHSIMTAQRAVPILLLEFLFPSVCLSPFLTCIVHRTEGREGRSEAGPKGHKTFSKVILAIQRSILVAQGLRPDEFFTLPRHAWTGTWRFYHFETMISIKSNISDTHMEEI